MAIYIHFPQVLTGRLFFHLSPWTAGMCRQMGTCVEKSLRISIRKKTTWQDFDIIKCQTQKPGGPDDHWNAAGRIMLLKMSTKTLGFLRNSKKVNQISASKGQTGCKNAHYCVLPELKCVISSAARIHVKHLHGGAFRTRGVL